MLSQSCTCKHAVLLYQDEGWLRQQVSQHIMSALRTGQAAIVVARPALLQELKFALHREHVQGAAFGPQRGSLVAIDAEEALASICVDGRPDEALFMRVFGTQVTQLAQDGPVAAYGEMVGILCERGQYADAVKLERLWNDLLAACEASLFCGYEHRLFEHRDSKPFYEQIRAAHDEVREDPRLVPAFARATPPAACPA